MVFLKRFISSNPKKRYATPSENIHPPVVVASVKTLGSDHHRNATLSTAATTGSVGGIVGNTKGKGVLGIGDDEEHDMLNLRLEKLPEHFNAYATCACHSLKDDIARLIVNQLRSLDFLMDSGSFAEKLMEILSISPHGLNKELIGSFPEIISDKCHSTAVSALEKMLLEDSEVIVPVLNSFTALNLDEQLLE